MGTSRLNLNFCRTHVKKCIFQVPKQITNTVRSHFATVRFTFTKLVRLDGAILTCAASLLQPKRSFSTQCGSKSFPVCMCSFSSYFSAVLLSWMWFFHPWHPSKTQKRRKNQQWTLHSFLKSSEPRTGPFSTKLKVIWLIIFSIICVIF